MAVNIQWCDRAKKFIATDSGRPGCSGLGDDEIGSLKDLIISREKWDKKYTRTRDEAL